MRERPKQGEDAREHSRDDDHADGEGFRGDVFADELHDGGGGAVDEEGGEQTECETDGGEHTRLGEDIVAGAVGSEPCKAQDVELFHSAARGEDDEVDEPQPRYAVDDEGEHPDEAGGVQLVLAFCREKAVAGVDFDGIAVHKLGERCEGGGIAVGEDERLGGALVPAHGGYHIVYRDEEEVVERGDGLVDADDGKRR